MTDEQQKPAPTGAGDPGPVVGERMALPSWDRGRTKKRGGAPAQDDAFQAGVKEVGQRAARRGPTVAIAALLGVGAVTAIVVVYARGQQASASATRVLAEAAAYESRAAVGDPELLLGKSAKRRPTSPVVKDEAARTEAVDKALGELTAQAGGSGAEIDGMLMRAARLMREGKAAEAEAEYRSFLERGGAGHPLRWAAREGLGFAREAQGDLDGALVEFTALAGEKGVFYRDMGLYHRARVLERQGKKDEALTVYHQYIAEYPLSDPSIAQVEVKKRLEELDPKAVVDALPESAVQVMDGPPGATP